MDGWCSPPATWLIGRERLRPLRSPRYARSICPAQSPPPPPTAVVNQIGISDEIIRKMGAAIVRPAGSPRARSGQRHSFSPLPFIRPPFLFIFTANPICLPIFPSLLCLFAFCVQFLTAVLRDLSCFSHVSYASAGKEKAGMVHSVSGWMRGVQVKLWDPLRTRAIPERFRGVFTTRRYTNPHLPLPLPFSLSVTVTECEHDRSQSLTLPVTALRTWNSLPVPFGPFRHCPVCPPSVDSWRHFLYWSTFEDHYSTQLLFLKLTSHLSLWLCNMQWHHTRRYSSLASTT